MLQKLTKLTLYTWTVTITTTATITRRPPPITQSPSLSPVTATDPGAAVTAAEKTTTLVCFIFNCYENIAEAVPQTRTATTTTTINRPSCLLPIAHQHKHKRRRRSHLTMPPTTILSPVARRSLPITRHPSPIAHRPSPIARRPPTPALIPTPTVAAVAADTVTAHNSSRISSSSSNADGRLGGNTPRPVGIVLSNCYGSLAKRLPPPPPPVTHRLSPVARRPSPTNINTDDGGGSGNRNRGYYRPTPRHH